MIKRLVEILRHQQGISHQLLCFLLIGGSATVLQLLLLIAGVEVLRIAVLPASIVSYLISALFNYCLNYRYTFNSTQKHRKALTKFMLVALLGVALNALLLQALLSLAVNYLLAQMVVIAILLVFNFTAHKYWTYRSSR